MHRVGHDQHLIKTQCGDIVGISNDFPDFKTNAKFGRVYDILNVNNCCYVVLDAFAIAELDEPFYLFDDVSVSKLIVPLKMLSSPVIYHRKIARNSRKIVVLCMPY